MKRTRTTVSKPKEVTRSWFVVDAASAPLGRVATQVARALSGKNKVDYTPHVDAGDFVVVVNTQNLYTTGKKQEQKVYHKYTGYPGNLKSVKLGTMQAEKPEKVFEKAVYGMLPKNKLRPARMERLKIYAKNEHPHDGQKPQKLENK